MKHIIQKMIHLFEAFIVIIVDIVHKDQNHLQHVVIYQIIVIVHVLEVLVMVQIIVVVMVLVLQDYL